MSHSIQVALSLRTSPPSRPLSLSLCLWASFPLCLHLFSPDGAHDRGGLTRGNISRSQKEILYGYNCYHKPKCTTSINSVNWHRHRDDHTSSWTGGPRLLKKLRNVCVNGVAALVNQTCLSSQTPRRQTHLIDKSFKTSNQRQKIRQVTSTGGRHVTRGLSRIAQSKQSRLNLTQRRYRCRLQTLSDTFLWWIENVHDDYRGIGKLCPVQKRMHEAAGLIC